MPDRAFNLLRAAWLPVIRQDGAQTTIRPADITGDIETNPVVAIAWPRPDFRIAALEFLIGLLSTAAPPAKEARWHGWWEEPPTPETLQAAFAPIAAAFDLDDDGPRFLQDQDALEGESLPPASLLIDQPGENARKNNTDLLVKRGGAPVLSRAAAAMALFTLQAFAPSGGAGHRTGFRGGGPLTTLVVPPPWRKARTLWHLLWANVASGAPADLGHLAQVFPWLASTLTSGKDGRPPLVRTDRNRLQMFWSMPRRIRLDFAPNVDGTSCGITGRVDEVVVTGWRTKPYGAQYDLAGWLHPLTPYYRPKANAAALPLHGQPGGIGYRDWLGLITNDSENNPTRLVAETVLRFRSSRAADLGVLPWSTRLLAAGYDMDNAKPRGFIEAELPLPILADPEAREALDDHARRLVGAVSVTADLLRSAVRAALFGPDGKPDPGSTVLQSSRDAFWAATEEAFYRLLHRATDAFAADPGADVAPLRQDWLAALRGGAFREFDTAAPLEPDAYRVRRADKIAGAQAIVAARRLLGASLAGYGKGGAVLFGALALPVPVQGATRGKAKRTAA